MSILSSFLSPSPLPPQYTAVQALQPGAQATGTQLTTTGQQLQTTGEKLFKQASPLIGAGESELATGASELAAAQAGTLTPEQQAVLAQSKNQLTNQAMQMYASEGRTPTKDTSFLGTEESISATMLAAAQSFIQSNIALAGQMITLGGQTISAGLGVITGATSMLSAGASDIGEGLAFETQGVNELISAGQAQTSLDNSYTAAVSSAFSAVAGMFGTAVGGKSGIGINLFGSTPAPTAAAPAAAPAPTAAAPAAAPAPPAA